MQIRYQPAHIKWKDLLCLFLFFFVFQIFAQGQSSAGAFTLTGTVAGRDSGMIVLWYADTDYRWARDTAYFNKGKFEFKGFIKEPSFAHLIGSKKEGNYNDFYLETGNQQIDLKENEFSSFKMSGSLSQRQADSLQFALNAIEEKYREWISEYDKLLGLSKTITDSVSLLPLKARIADLANKNDRVYKEMFQKKLSFIVQHPDSYVSAVELYSLLTNGRQIKTDFADSVYILFSDRIRDSRFGTLLKTELDKRKIGSQAANFTAKDIKGRSVTLSAFKGRYVLIDFWASWCVPCLEQIPELKTFQKKYNTKGLEIVCVSVDTNSQKWMEAIKKYQTENFYHLLTNDDIASKYSNVKQPIPSQILINNNGIVVWNSFDMSKELKEVLEIELGR